MALPFARVSSRRGLCSTVGIHFVVVLVVVVVVPLVFAIVAAGAIGATFGSTVSRPLFVFVAPVLAGQRRRPARRVPPSHVLSGDHGGFELVRVHGVDRILPFAGQLHGRRMDRRKARRRHCCRHTTTRLAGRGRIGRSRSSSTAPRLRWLVVRLCGTTSAVVTRQHV